jgi:hypothetical protein
LNIPTLAGKKIMRAKEKKLNVKGKRLRPHFKEPKDKFD